MARNHLPIGVIGSPRNPGIALIAHYESMAGLIHPPPTQHDNRSQVSRRRTDENA
jgi:hypothetical protein